MKTAPKKATRIKAGRIQRANYKWIYLFLLPTIVIFAMFYLMPIAQVFVTSFTKWDGFNAPKFNGLTNYINLFTNSSFLIALKNLLWWCVIALTLHVGFGTLVAFVLYQRPHGWKFTRTVFMIPNVISAAAWAMIYKFIFNNDFGILNSVIRVFNPNFNVQWFYKSPWAFWAVTFTWLFYAVIVTLVVLGDLMNIPKELNEAALMDGATGWQLIRYIQLPLCRASIGTSVIASLTSRIAMYEQIALTTSGGPGDDTMSLPIILVKGIMDYRYGYANAVGVVMFIIGLIVLGMGSLFEWITDWIKEGLIDAITGQYTSIFNSVNNQVADVANQVGQTPQGWNGGVFSMIQNLSETVVIPIAGMILTFVLVYELIQMILEKNNMHEFDTFNIFKWIFKTFVATYLLTNCFTIVMAVFDVAQNVVSQSAGVINGNLDVQAALSDLETQLEAMGMWELIGLWLETNIINLCMWVLSIVIFVIVYGRMIEIYLTVSLAPIPFSTMANREWGQMGTGYLRSLFALGFQGFLILICVAIYAVLVQSIPSSGDVHGAIWGTAGYTVLLAFALFKTGSLSKSIFNAR